MKRAPRPVRPGLRPRRRGSEFGSSEEGATAVEFGIVGSLFFFAVTTMLELGTLIFTQNQLQYAVGQAGREIRTGQITDINGFRDEICTHATMISDCTNKIGFNVSSATGFAGLSPPTIDQIIPPTSRSFLPGTPGQAVAVLVTFDWQFILPSMRPLGNVNNGAARRLLGVAVFRNEPL